MDNKIKCAVIGLGRIGSTLELDSKREKPASHTGAVLGNKECILVAGCDINSDRREEYSKLWKVPTYTDFATMLSETKVDIVHIATPPETHRELFEVALNAKIPVIVCEKPVAPNYTGAQKMLDLSQNYPSKVLVNHERRYALPYTYIAQTIKNKKYGDIVSVSGKLFMGLRRKNKAVLVDDGTHMIDLFHFLLGQSLTVKHVSGDAEGNEHALSAVLSAGEIPVLLEIGSGRDHIVFEVDISFKAGRIIAGNGYYAEYKSEESPYYDNMRSLIQQEIQEDFSTSFYFESMFQDAVALYKGKTKVPISSLSDGVEALRVIENMLK